MNEIQIDKETHLIKAFARHGIVITLVDIPEVLRLGVDTFMLQRGISIPEKPLLEIYLILNELR